VTAPTLDTALGDLPDQANDPDLRTWDETSYDNDFPPPERTADRSANGADPEAPFGRKADGTPYKVDPSIYTKRDANRGRSRSRAGRKAAPAPPKKTASGPAAAPPSRGRVDYRPGIRGLIAIPVGALTAAGVSVPEGRLRDALLADAATVDAFAAPLAEAGQLAADADPRVAALLDRVLQAGPYGAALAVGIQLAAQLAANHGWLKPGFMGTRDPRDLVAELVSKHASSDAG
jgi:hypothetical protein